LKFVNTHHLKTSTIPPVALYLFDSLLNNIISEIANLPIIFPTSDCMNLDVRLTKFGPKFLLIFLILFSSSSLFFYFLF